MTGFSYEIKDLGDLGLELVLVGYMDEQTILPEISKFANTNKLAINFGRVNSLLSMGVKAFVLFSDQLESLPHLKIEFKNCSKQVVDQINLVNGFLPKNATVTSIFVPLSCQTCNRTFRVLKKTDNIKTEISNVIAELDVPDCDNFPDCKASFELECSPKGYLKFLDF